MSCEDTREGFVAGSQLLCGLDQGSFS
jgi:hypothetical protein